MKITRHTEQQDIYYRTRALVDFAGNVSTEGPNRSADSILTRYEGCGRDVDPTHRGSQCRL